MLIPSRHISLVGLLIAIPLVAWLYVYHPMNSAVQNVASEIRLRTGELSHYDDVNTQYRKLQSLKNTLKQSTKHATDRVPLEHKADIWLQSASEAALNLGLVVKSVTTAGAREEGEYKILPVDLNVIGSFESVYGLMQHLEQMKRISRVDRMHIHQVTAGIVEARIIIQLIFSSEMKGSS
jgi:Tfp pilus assembly protein PilO